jgi:hypothetical protein
MAPESHNMRLISRDKLGGFGNVGEGMSMQLTSSGRRILWLAHESAPKNFTGVDVTDPAHPVVICQTELPHRNVRSNSLEVCGDVMAVAYQTSTHGLQPAGIELFDISNPEAPRVIGFFDCSGPSSRGVHQLWFVDGKTVYFAGGAPDFTPRNLLDVRSARSMSAIQPNLGKSAAGGSRGSPRAMSNLPRRGTQNSTAVGARIIPMSIRNVRTGHILGISTAGRSFSISAISISRRWPGTGIHTLRFRALPIPPCHCSTATC